MADPAYLYAPVIGLLVGGLMVLRKDQVEVGNSSLLMTEKSFRKILGYRDLWMRLRLRGQSR